MIFPTITFVTNEGRVLTYVSPRHFNGGIPVHVAEKAEAEALRVGGVCEAVDRE